MKLITVGLSPMQKREPLKAILFVGHLGLEIFSGKPSTARVSLGPIDFVVCCRRKPVQTNETKSITVGESPTNKKKRKPNGFLFVGHLGLEPRTSRL